MPSLTPTQIELQLERPNVTGVFVEDVIGMGTPGGGTAKLVSGYVNFQNALQKFQDVFEIVPSFLMKLVESTQYEFSQNMTVDIALTLLENIYQVQQTIEVVPSVDATAIILPPNISLCNPNNVPQPNESSSVSSNNININATVQVQESLCIPPYDLLADTFQEFFGLVSGLLENLEDIIAVIVQFQPGISYQNSLSDVITEAIGYSPVAPQNESYTFYVPIDTPVTYTIEQVGSGSYTGSLSYSVSASS